MPNPVTAVQPFSLIAQIAPKQQKKPLQQAANCYKRNSALPTALQHLSKTQKATESVCTAHTNPNSHKISHYYYKNLT